MQAINESFGGIYDLNPSARSVLSSMRHIQPNVIFENAPLSYMLSGQAQNFYQGEGQNTDFHERDPSSINYFVVKAVEKNWHTTDDDHHDHHHKCGNFGLRLVGIIPFSDTFGVDINTDDFIQKIEERKEQRKLQKEKLMQFNPMKPDLLDYVPPSPIR